MTVLSPSDQALKRAARELVEAAGGIVAGAALTRVRPSRLADYGNVNVADAFMPIDVARDLEAVTQGLPGAPVVTRHLALRAGFGLVPLPGAADPQAKTCHQHLADLGKEFGEAIAAVAATLAGGVIDRADVRGRRDAVREIDDLIRVAMCTRAALTEGD